MLRSQSTVRGLCTWQQPLIGVSSVSPRIIALRQTTGSCGALRRLGPTSWHQQRTHVVRLSSSNRDERSKSGSPRPVRRSFFAFFNVLGWGSVLYVVVVHVGSVGSTMGHSMSPTINPSVGDKDVVLLNRFVFTRLWYMLQRTKVYRNLFASDPYPFSVGDVVFLVSPFDPNLMTCKRVLALPGDVVAFEDSHGAKHKMRIPPRHVWVEGDASADGGDRPIRTSRDSRQYGPIHMDLIKSRVEMIVWPPTRFGRLPPRPGFDADHMRHLRQMRQTRTQYGQVGTLHAGRPHSADSPLTPYVEWEWTTDDRASEGMNLLKKPATNGDSSSAPRRKAKANDQERAELMRQTWNQASRGGRLGDDAKDED